MSFRGVKRRGNPLKRNANTVAVATSYFCSSSTKVERRELKNKTSPLPFGHSPIAQNYAVILQSNTSFARGEIGTRIDRDNSLVMPPSFVRQLRNNTAQSLVLRTQGLPHGKNKRTCACISKMKAKFFAVWEEEHKEPRRTTATCCG